MREARSLLEAVDESVSDLDAPAAKLDPSELAVLNRLRRYLRDTGVVEVLEDLLGEHPGRRSCLHAETLLLGPLMSDWQVCSYLRTDVAVRLLRLPPGIKAELGMFTDAGQLGLKYRTLHKQMSRLEALLGDQSDNDGPYGLEWLERQMIAASVPDEIRGIVEAVAVDETAFRSWYRTRCHAVQAQVDKAVRDIYRQRDGDGPVPDMSSPQMRAIAAEIGIQIGADGRVQRTPTDPGARGGQKTATAKRPGEKYIGYASATVSASRSHTLSRNSDRATLGPRVPLYVLATTCWPANTNPGPGGFDLLQRAFQVAHRVDYVLVDMGSRTSPRHSRPRCAGPVSESTWLSPRTPPPSTRSPLDGSQHSEPDPHAPQAHSAAPDHDGIHRVDPGAAAASRAPP